MKWLKYQHKFSSGRYDWRWQPLYNDDIDKDGVEDILCELADAQGHSERYNGIDYEVVDCAPQWVVERLLQDAGGRVRTAEADIRMLLPELTRTFECWQCKGATVATAEHYKQHGTGTVIRGCPTCGRPVLYETIPFLVSPDDADAVKLLGSLVEQGERSVKSKTFRWPLEDEDEEAAYTRLSKLGLVGGSAYQNVYKIHANECGKAEWQKHKEQCK
jgi:transcription elongation factor Elf1